MFQMFIQKRKYKNNLTKGNVMAYEMCGVSCPSFKDSSASASGYDGRCEMFKILGLHPEAPDKHQVKQSDICKFYEMFKTIKHMTLR